MMVSLPTQLTNSIKTIKPFKSSWNDWLKDEKHVFDDPFDGLHLRGSYMEISQWKQNSCETQSQFNHTGHVGTFSLW